MVQTVARVLENHQVARDTWRLRLHAPEVAARIMPGQFFMLRTPQGCDPLLGRPFALLDVAWSSDRAQSLPPDALDLGYVVVGKFTHWLTQQTPGRELVLWGPLGQGFPVLSAQHVTLVAGGIGQTPFVAVIREALGFQQYGQPPRQIMERPRRISMCYGVRSRDYLAGCDWFQLPGVSLEIATNDGSTGYHGFVTDLLQRQLASPDPPQQILACGPEGMLRAVAQLARQAGVPCWVSLETPMACGIGACFSCVVRVIQPDGSWDYRRSCLEGPVFSAEHLVFEGS